MTIWTNSPERSVKVPTPKSTYYKYQQLSRFHTKNQIFLLNLDDSSSRKKHSIVRAHCSLSLSHISRDPYFPSYYLRPHSSSRPLPLQRNYSEKPRVQGRSGTSNPSTPPMRKMTESDPINKVWYPRRRHVGLNLVIFLPSDILSSNEEIKSDHTNSQRQDRFS